METQQTANELDRPYIPGTIGRIESEYVVIELADNQQLRFPKDKLPENSQEGSHVRVIVGNDATEQQERELRAKTVLNEILKNSE